MAKKTPEEFIIELKELYIQRELKCLEKLLIVDTRKKTKEEIELEEEWEIDERKFLKNLKSRLKFVEDLNNKLIGKTGKERAKGEEDIMAKIIDMQSSVGKIVRQIPKTGSE